MFFEHAQQKSLQRRQAASKPLQPQRDAGVIEVHAVDFLDERGRPVDAIDFQGPITLRIKFRCAVPLPHPEIIVGFHTSDFVQVLSASNAMAGVQPDLAAGEYEVCCRFDQIPLRPFTYGLKLLFVDHRNGTLWSGESIRYTAVSPGKADITKFPSAGLVFAPTRWTFARVHDLPQSARDCVIIE